MEAEEVAKTLLDKAKPLFLAKSPKMKEMPTPIQGGVSSEVSLTKPLKVADMPLIQYLTNFWTPNSEYACYKRDVKKKPLTTYYIEMNHDDVRRHIEPFPGFAGEDISGRRANAVLQSMRVAIRWAVDNEKIPTALFRKLGDVAEIIHEKGVLTLEERNCIIDALVVDYRTRLVMLLGCLCSMRRGEMRGLQWGDIEDGTILIRHNYQDKDSLKLPKYNSVRKVPISTSVQKLSDKAREYSADVSPDSFILSSLDSKKPLSNNFFRNAVYKELEAVGISLDQQKNKI
jgi:integrase